MQGGVKQERLRSFTLSVRIKEEPLGVNRDTACVCAVLSSLNIYHSSNMTAADSLLQRRVFMQNLLKKTEPMSADLVAFHMWQRLSG